MIVSRREPSPAGAGSPFGSDGSRAGAACTANRLDTVASATSVAQINTDSATWSTTAHGRRRDQTFMRPEMI